MTPSLIVAVGVLLCCSLGATQELSPMLRLDWREGPEYPMGIQDAVMGIVEGKIISAGGFTRHPKEVVKLYPDAFAGQPNGFTALTFLFDPATGEAGWTRIADIPGPPRQGAAGPLWTTNSTPSVVSAIPNP